MSHWSTIKTEFKSKKHLLDALKELGYKVQENAQIKGWGRMTKQANIAVTTERGETFGFNKNGENYEAVADSMTVSNYTDRINKIRQTYTKNVTIERLRRNGYNIVSNEKDADGQIKILARRY